jgi:hypothetical protein
VQERSSDHENQIAAPILAVRPSGNFAVGRNCPRIAGGRVTVKLHLLAPNYRPVQITDDAAKLLVNDLFPGAKRYARAIPKTFVAGRPAHRHATSERLAAEIESLFMRAWLLDDQKGLGRSGWRRLTRAPRRKAKSCCA